MAVLETFDLGIRFGGVQALNDVNIKVDEWEIVGIIGPNGAGKTTLFNCISGFYTPTSGRVRHRGVDITELPVHARSARGVGRTFQNVGLVKGSNAIENLLTAQHLSAGYDYGAGIFGSPVSLAAEHTLRTRAMDLLDLLGLADLAEQRVADLPYGMQKRLELAAVLATDPDVMLLDEPGSGLGPEEADQLGDILLELRHEFGVTIVMIDHHVPLVTRISDHVYCLNFGQLLVDGPPEVVRSHPEVVRAYLGSDDEDDDLDSVEAG